jgi:RsiW-degrading membrane proteinase PrsW (M82 family)
VYNQTTAVIPNVLPAAITINIYRGGTMLLLAKLAALGIVIWFYMTADEHNEPPFKWVVTGLIGYVIVWFLVDFVFDSLMSAKIARNGTLSFIISQIPAFAGLAAAYFIRKKMISNLTTAKSE